MEDRPLRGGRLEHNRYVEVIYTSEERPYTPHQHRVQQIGWPQGGHLDVWDVSCLVYLTYYRWLKPCQALLKCQPGGGGLQGPDYRIGVTCWYSRARAGVRQRQAAHGTIQAEGTHKWISVSTQYPEIVHCPNHSTPLYPLATDCPCFLLSTSKVLPLSPESCCHPSTDSYTLLKSTAHSDFLCLYLPPVCSDSAHNSAHFLVVSGHALVHVCDPVLAWLAVYSCMWLKLNWKYVHDKELIVMKYTYLNCLHI
jgi:hypothetical protein